MIHLKIFEEFLLLEKAELKYSETALNTIYNICKTYRSKKNILKSKEKTLKQLGLDDNITISFPLREVVYEDSFKIKVGLLISAIHGKATFDDKHSIGGKNVFGVSDELMEKIKIMFKDIVKNKKINNDAQVIIDEYLKEKIETITFTIKADWLSTQGGSYNMNSDILEIDLGPTDFSSDNQLKSIIRHELQHSTQTFGGKLLSSAKKLFVKYHLLENNFQDDTFTKTKIKDKSFKYKFNIFLKNFLVAQYYTPVYDEKTRTRKRIKSKFGESKTKSNFNQNSGGNSPMKKFTDQLSLEIGMVTGKKIGTGGQNYFGDDVEYHTWLSDKLDKYTRKYKKVIDKNDTKTAADIIFKKIEKDNIFKMVKGLKKEAPKDYYKLLNKRIDKMKGLN